VIEPKQVRERASKLYYDIKRRSEPKLWKTGRLRGRTRWAGVPVPYSSDDFAAWLMQTIGCNAFPCPYCGAPLDVLSMVLDHDVPLHSGGTNEFSNLVPTCRDDNELKGSMTGADYRIFRRLIRQLSPPGEADVVKRLRFGLHGMRLSQQMRAQKSKQKPLMVEEPF
jgi:5-methylcytosine-specific restriction endonuclease McrA